MSSPSTETTITKKKKKACRRCRHRKQKCDFEQPCHNCRTSGAQCESVVQERTEQYPIGYVSALEDHAASLEKELSQKFPSAAADHMDFEGSLGVVSNRPLLSPNANANFQPLPESDMSWQWQNPQTPHDMRTNSNAHIAFGVNNTSPPQLSSWSQPSILESGFSHPKSPVASRQNDIPVCTAASYFRTYFQFVHPQYPFLELDKCSEWYTRWKVASPADPLDGWPAYCVKMIFAIGSLLQSKSDDVTRFPHDELKSHAQVDNLTIQNQGCSPIIRLQSMLLSAVYALHSESTISISHLKTLVMRIAGSKFGFGLVPMQRGASATLDIPVSLADSYISSPLFTEFPEVLPAMPWLHDLPNSTEQTTIPGLGNFAHTCKIRLMYAEGYQSPLWLHLIAQLSRLVLCRPSKRNIHTEISEMALRASCEACTTFRALQKKRQVAQPWLVVLTQFQAGVTILYIIWARGITIPTEADLAIRDCASVLAILADRWQNAERYRDCFEFLARTIPRCTMPGHLENDARTELAGLIEKVNESGVHGHVRTMLYEIAGTFDGANYNFVGSRT
ncbi:Zn2/Cys6 DNA-binding protein [Glarea lozoyensis ATCC 20868]|uniref:Zn2/Cys6 DNA-binding protein n=1 Tax=Glarea lozoyensis (strain ATCC 20868 / MF5171) TaxID=1116229 RepID=S3E7L6_GLAL2|nr:Zn2/Cys6 DNA-binding protein [Glarea lozoyensis ATCC 20868]EPE34298.1 Zn2/Cys6 DNA-binding protein [Glarea lozoyensis ATCC 20868]